ncbi:MAG: ABC transporter permease [Clostridiales bacterium]|nr:ABC transporter permease [Clostridiales bacterium]
MAKKILKRLFLSLFVLLGVTIVAFVMVRLGGGNPASLMAGALATEEEIADMEVRMGLDKPLIVQYFKYLSGVLHGDLGYSWNYQMNVTDLLAVRIPQTLKLCFFGFGWACIFSIILGIIAGIHQGQPIDFVALFIAIAGQSMSIVWISFMLILVFGVTLKVLPTQGIGGIRYMLMPGLCIGFGYAANQTRLMRSGMVDVLREDYVTATRARGVSKNKTYFKYALKNAILPIITNIGSQFGRILVGSTVVENIFNWPGMGQLIVQAINMRDYQLVQSILLVSACMIVFCNLLADIAYTIIDPRITFN